MLVVWLSTFSSVLTLDFFCLKYRKVLPFMMLQLLPRILQKRSPSGPNLLFLPINFLTPIICSYHHCYVVSSLLFFLSLRSDSKAHFPQEVFADLSGHVVTIPKHTDLMLFTWLLACPAFDLSCISVLNFYLTCESGERGRELAFIKCFLGARLAPSCTFCAWHRENIQ